jgi:hypothetical protein
MNARPGYQLRVWITNEDLAILKRFAEETESQQTEILTRIVHAGLQGIKNEKHLILPLKFTLLKNDTHSDLHANEKKISRSRSILVGAR